MAGSDGPSQLATSDEAAIGRLHAMYWACADGLDPLPAEELFAEDAVLMLGNVSLRGRGEIGAFFAKRAADQKATGRVTRHLSPEPILRMAADGRVTADCVAISMAGSGPLPIASSVPSVADFSDVLARQDDGAWLFEKRRVTPIFVSPEAPAFARG